jgi:hypothetical protein
MSVSVGVFISSVSSSICGSFEYALTYYDGSSIDTNLFTFNPTLASLTVFTGSSSSINTYQFMVTAY